MSRTLLLLLISTTVLLMNCGKSEPFAGNGSQVGSVSATLIYEDSSKASDVRVLIHSDDHNPGLNRSGIEPDTVYTDDSGSLIIEGLEPGDYTLTANDGKGKGAFVENFTVTDSEMPLLDLGNLELNAAGSLNGSVILSLHSDKNPVLIQLIGTGYFTFSDSSGAFTLQGIPSGQYNLNITDTSGNYDTFDTVISIETGTAADAGTITLSEPATSFKRVMTRYSFEYQKTYYDPSGAVIRIAPEYNWEESWIRFGIFELDFIDTLILYADSFYIRQAELDYDDSSIVAGNQIWGSYTIRDDSICFLPFKTHSDPAYPEVVSEDLDPCYLWNQKSIYDEGCRLQSFVIDPVPDTLIYNTEHYDQPCDEAFPNKSHSLDSLALVDYWIKLE